MSFLVIDCNTLWKGRKMEFKAIETKEEFDEAIKEPIRLAQE